MSMNLKACSRLLLVLVVVNEAVGQTFLCKDKLRSMDKVFDPYSPLCDQRLDSCDDNSDEMFCNYNSSPRYTGCWSYESIGGQIVYRIVNCTECLCAANLDRCIEDDALGRICDVCITQPQLVGNGSPDCMFGIDESKDAVYLKNKLPQLWREVLFRAVWRCRKPTDSQVTFCSHIHDSLIRKPFIVNFPIDSLPDAMQNVCEDVSKDDQLRFWTCQDDDKCIRNLEPCLKYKSYPTCQPGFIWKSESKVCEAANCPEGEWYCDSKKKCISVLDSCEGLCKNSNYYICKQQYCNLLKDPCVHSQDHIECPINRYFCPDTFLCQEKTWTCRSFGRSSTSPSTSSSSTTTTSSISLEPQEISTPVADCEDPLEEWFCPSEQKCISMDTKCSEKCHESKKPCSSGVCIHPGHICPEECPPPKYICKSDVCLEGSSLCDGQCQPGFQTCFYLTGNFDCYPKNECLQPSSTTTTTLKPTEASTSTTEAEPSCHDDEELPCPEGDCLEGRELCNATNLCLMTGDDFDSRCLHEEAEEPHQEVWPWISLGVALALMIVVVPSVLFFFQAKRKEAKRSKQRLALGEFNITFHNDTFGATNNEPLT